MNCTNPNCECKSGTFANLNPPTKHKTIGGPKSEARMRENASDHQALLDIHELMDGVSWSPDTLDAIAEILEGAGYPIQF